MNKNELRFVTTHLGEQMVSLWVIKPKPYHDWLIAGESGKSKLHAMWNLVKWLYRHGDIKSLFYIRSIKYERK